MLEEGVSSSRDRRQLKGSLTPPPLDAHRDCVPCTSTNLESLFLSTTYRAV